MAALPPSAGSRDRTLIIWDEGPPAAQSGRGAGGALPLQPAPRRVLYGHDDAVTCLAVCPELDLVLSGSADGAILFHTLGEGRCACDAGQVDNYGHRRSGP